MRSAFNLCDRILHRICLPSAWSLTSSHNTHAVALCVMRCPIHRRIDKVCPHNPLVSHSKQNKKTEKRGEEHERTSNQIKLKLCATKGLHLSHSLSQSSNSAGMYPFLPRFIFDFHCRFRDFSFKSCAKMCLDACVVASL